MLKETAEDVLKKISEYNLKINFDAIPHSDTLKKEIMAGMGLTDKQLIQILNILKDSHKIFIIEIVKEDKSHDIKRIEGYVESSPETIRRLKGYFQNLLMYEYEKQFKQKMFVHQIAKEAYQGRSAFKNTPLGQIANKAIMLEEFENLITRQYDQYNDEWKEKKFAELIKIAEDIMNKAAGQTEPAETESKNISSPQKLPPDRRAIDTEEFTRFSLENQHSLKKVLSIYGVEFFFRVNLRRYNFTLIREAIEKGEIDSKSDLKLLKTMVQTVKSNLKKDPKLIDFQDDIYKLERAASRYILMSKK